MQKIWDILVIGMGASGCMAGIAAALHGASVALIDGNEKVGKKIYITGKGRCNVTNATPLPEFMDGLAHNSRFLYSALYHFTNQDLMDFFAQHGQNVKIERGERVFPTSDHSNDINRVLEKVLRENGATLYFHHLAEKIAYDAEHALFTVSVLGRETMQARRLILACGGQSYPSTGSTGDGYRFAAGFGHSIQEPHPSLVPITLSDPYIATWEGISLKNIALKARLGKRKKPLSCFGEMLFTREGISGPVVLTLSALLAGKKNEEITLSLDWKPALDAETLRKRLVREREKAPNRALSTLFQSFLPKRCTDVFLEKGGWDAAEPFHSWTREQEEHFIALLKDFPLTFSGFGSFKQAVITRGGVTVKEIDPSTMESRKQKGLYIAGEMADVDGFTGGYNLQIAFSMGHLAGDSAAASLNGK